MILKEIQLDLPFVENRDSKSNSVLDYENLWKDKRREFQLKTRCMTSMIERLMPTIRTDDYWKILIECVNDSPRKEYQNLLGVLSIQILFDINGFDEMSDLEKKKYVISKILEATDSLIDNGKLEMSQLKETCKMVIEMNYENIWFWKKPVNNKNQSVQIKINHDIENVKVYMVFKNNKDTKEVLLIEDVPSEWSYSNYLGKLEWISDKEAQLVAKDGTTYIGCCD